VFQVVEAVRSEESDAEDGDDHRDPGGGVGEESRREALGKEGTERVREREAIHHEKGVHYDSHTHNRGGERADDAGRIDGADPGPRARWRRDLDIAHSHLSAHARSALTTRIEPHPD
jgi:hypothetical protein